ncbi:hypothetical protein POM88_046035 [Heracleum sosnowskyi]|uniref:Uncharacterized protein n=1 Tax=Heracleum sosnowskyi TaxID=360622 RepID=A0AAD8M5J5_9APIA|nr:hypothetical protein POM88_046035 [Heracleum sosnowskyi]
MDQTHSLEKLTEEFIDEFCFDDVEDNRRLELYHEIYGQSSRSKPRKSIFRDREADERDTYATQFGPLPTYDDATNGLMQPNLGEEPFIPYETYIQNIIQMRDKRTHRQLQNDLIEHISQFHNNR